LRRTSTPTSLIVRGKGGGKRKNRKKESADPFSSLYPFLEGREKNTKETGEPGPVTHYIFLFPAEGGEKKIKKRVRYDYPSPLPLKKEERRGKKKRM